MSDERVSIDGVIDRFTHPGVIERRTRHVDPEIGGSHSWHRGNPPARDRFVVADIARGETPDNIELFLMDQVGEFFEGRRELDRDLVEIRRSCPVVVPPLEDNGPLHRAHLPSIGTGSDRVGWIELLRNDRHRFESGEQERRGSSGLDFDCSFVYLEQHRALDLVELVAEDPA
jgi:hypothetical protein